MRSERYVNLKGIGKVPLSKFIPKKSDLKKVGEELNRKTLPQAYIKPGRTQGAVWMDQFVARGKSVSLCMNCDHHYGTDWQRKYGYVPQRRYREITDCDGCGTQLSFCTGFYHSETPTGKLIQKFRR